MRHILVPIDTGHAARTRSAIDQVLELHRKEPSVIHLLRVQRPLGADAGAHDGLGPVAAARHHLDLVEVVDELAQAAQQRQAEHGEHDGDEGDDARDAAAVRAALAGCDAVFCCLGMHDITVPHNPNVG